MTHLKICGLTNTEDALAALDAGADYLGFNFYPPSPRYLAPEQCARIVSDLTRLTSHLSFSLVGIFVNESPAHVLSILDQCGLHLAQLHGDETPEEVAQYHGRAFKAFRGLGQNHPPYVHASAPAFLIDAYSPHAYGGTGHIADWSAARSIAQQHPIFLAGGLTPLNVAEAIRQVRPWGVDVASGVESAPGKKDHAKMRAFADARRKVAL